MLGMDNALESEWITAAAYLKRIKVDGGHLYLHIGKINSCMCFVPDIDLTRYESHLRDAYTKGHADGREEGIKLGEERARHATLANIPEMLLNHK